MTPETESAAGTRNDGNVALEYGLILPVLLLLVLGVMDVSRFLWTYVTLNQSVDTAARCAAVNPTACGTTSAIQSYAVTQAWGLSILPSAFTITYPACGVRVTTTYSFTFVIPWYGAATPFGPGNTLTLSAAACYPT